MNRTSSPERSPLSKIIRVPFGPVDELIPAYRERNIARKLFRVPQPEMERRFRRAISAIVFRTLLSISITLGVVYGSYELREQMIQSNKEESEEEYKKIDLKLTTMFQAYRELAALLKLNRELKELKGINTTDNLRIDSDFLQRVEQDYAKVLSDVRTYRGKIGEEERSGLKIDIELSISRYENAIAMISQKTKNIFMEIFGLYSFDEKKTLFPELARQYIQEARFLLEKVKNKKRLNGEKVNKMDPFESDDRLNNMEAKNRVFTLFCQGDREGLERYETGQYKDLDDTRRRLLSSLGDSNLDEKQYERECDSLYRSLLVNIKIFEIYFENLLTSQHASPTRNQRKT